MRSVSLSITVASALCVGCAAPSGHRGFGANWEPVIDVRADQRERYSADLVDCQAHATKVMSAHEAAVGGAVAGAILGALLGAAAGGNSKFNSHMAGVGGLGAGVSAAAAAEGGQRGIISRCMTGRGYTVLN